MGLILNHNGLKQASVASSIKNEMKKLENEMVRSKMKDE